MSSFITYRDEEQFTRSNHIDNAFGIDENLEHHLLFRSWGGFAFWMSAVMHLVLGVNFNTYVLYSIEVAYNTVHVQI